MLSVQHLPKHSTAPSAMRTQSSGARTRRSECDNATKQTPFLLFPLRFSLSFSATLVLFLQFPLYFTGFFFCSFRSSFLISTFSSVSIFVHQFSLSFSDFFNLVFTITFIFVGFLVIRTSTYDVRTRCFLACFDLLKSQKSTPSS